MTHDPEYIASPCIIDERREAAAPVDDAEHDDALCLLVITVHHTIWTADDFAIQSAWELRDASAAFGEQLEVADRGSNPFDGNLGIPFRIPGDELANLA